MKVLLDQWTPLFRSLKNKVSPFSRRMLLSQIIGDIQDITQQNFGNVGLDRPRAWPLLNQRYAQEWKYGDTTPNLMLSPEKHNLRNPNLPHLIDCFRAMVNENKATLTNLSPYADNHQLGLGIPARPYYPVTDDGQNLTPFSESRLKEIVDKHFRS